MKQLDFFRNLQIKRTLWVLFFFLVSCSVMQKQISVGYDPTFYAGELEGRQAELTGFFSDLFLEMSKQENVNFTLHEKTRDSLDQGLVAKEYQIALQYVSARLFSLPNLHYSNLLLSTGPVIVVPFTSEATSFKDLSGKEVGMVMDEESVDLVGRNPEILPRYYGSQAQMLEDLKEGKIHAALVPSLFAVRYVNDLYSHELKIATAPLTNSGMRFVALSQQEVDECNRMIDKLKSSGRYNEILAKWKL